MSGISTTETATEGIRLTRLRSRAVLVWAVAYLGFTILLGRIAELTLGPHSAELLSELRQAGQFSNEEFWALAWQTWPFWAVGLPVHFGFQAILTCAIYRAILHPAEEEGGYVRIGADELRMAALNLLLSLMWIVVFFAVGLAAIFVGLLTGLAGSALFTGVAAVVWLGAVVTVASTLLVRLSLAGAITFSERRIRIRASWAMTKGLFWPLLGAYVLAFILWLVLIIVLRFSFWLLLVMVNHISGLNLSHPDPASADPLIFAAFLITAATTALLLTCSTVFLTAPPAEAYRELTQ